MKEIVQAGPYIGTEEAVTLAEEDRQAEQVEQEADEQ